MNVSCRQFRITKRHPLTISRGTSAFSDNLLVSIDHDGITGLGEMAPTSGGDAPETAEDAERRITALSPYLAECAPWEFQRIEALIEQVSMTAAAAAALDIAMHDWIGKRAGMPLADLFGGYKARIPDTTITIGISALDSIAERVAEVTARYNRPCIKVKLGNPEGIEADQALVSAIQAVPHSPAVWIGDANGGWTVESALIMIKWLELCGCRAVEQPLPRGQEADLPKLHKSAGIPIYLDESVRTSRDIPAIARAVDGINIKLMKSGGLREAIRMVHTARAHSLKVMVGCMSESSLAISAAAAITPYVDHADLDSHLNLVDDPFRGAVYSERRIVPTDLAGVGAVPITG
ncbi:MAG: dipeptide epimerase [Armatimonadetes bacterium]|nr:dipeptide epimerase [Armatimonadota bacterium]MDE2206396.1 dipeptide epimerase [Armatimonadota bacterium]